MTPITPYPEIDDLLHDLRSRVRGILDNRLLGLYLYGSLVAGDFEPGVSDADMLAVVASTLTGGELDALRAMHDTFAAEHPAWDDRIEVAYVPTAALKTFRTQETTIAVISPGEPFHAKQAGREWLMNWWIVRQQGVTLFGPPPETFIDPISREEFLENVRLHSALWLDWLDESPGLPAQSYVMITACRALYAIRRGAQTSKSCAIAWVQERYPEYAGLLGDALAWREGTGRDCRDPGDAYPETVRFIQFMIAQIMAEKSGS
jgi:hypothetical protein